MFVRSDLSYAQKVVQAGHALIDMTKLYPYKNGHPTVVVFGINKDEEESN